MFDVVTDIPAPDQIEVFAGTVADRMSITVGGRFEPELDGLIALAANDIIGHRAVGEGRGAAIDLPPVGARLKELLATPGQLVGLGQGLAYMERVSPLGSRA